jgi:hypothetical protein
MKHSVVFIVNKGYPWYLTYVAEQIEISNGKDSVALILDQEYPDAKKFKTLLMPDYSKMATGFAGIFKSLFRPDGHHEFELIWFQRYMFVLEYLESVAYKGDFWVVDSDVMIYSDLRKVKILDGIRFTRLKEEEPCFTWFAEPAVLREFCEYMINYYKFRLPELESYFIRNYIKGTMRGGICEMVLLRWFADERVSTCQDLSLPVNGWAFDPGIQGHDGYRQNPIGGKKIYWDKGMPYGIKKGKRINFHALHCQGNYKNLIPVYFSGRSDPHDVAKGKRWRRAEYLENAPKNLLKRALGRQ